MAVEDEDDIRVILRFILQNAAHFDLLLCANGKEAIEKFEKFSPDLVLLDMMMPGMDGVSTMQALKAEPSFKNTPIIFMTAKVQSDEIKRYLDLGAIAVISKPFDPATLAEQLLKAWEKHINESVTS